MPKISALPPAGTLADDDETPFVDDSVAITKKFTLAGLLAWLQSKTSWITTAMLSDTQVTPSKLDLDPATAEVSTSQTTTSATFTNLATVGPSVTVNVGVNGLLLVILYSSSDNSVSGVSNRMGYDLSGANTLAAADAFASMTGINQLERKSSVFLHTGLTPGSTTLTMKYRAGTSGTASFSNRKITAIPL